MAIYICTVCDTLYDEEKEGVKWEDLPDDWLCPVCDSPKFMFNLLEENKTIADSSGKGIPEKPGRTLTVSDIMVETMINWGVKVVFGMVGHSNLGLAEAIRKKCESGKLKFIGIRHEGAASFAASAYAKLTDTPAACLAIAGPGATNLLTGLWDAKMDRAPVLALTGQIDVQVLGPGAFQEIDLAGAFSPVSCWSQTVLESSNFPELMSLALKNAIVQRGVSHLIFPDSVQELPVSSTLSTPDSSGRLACRDIAPAPESLIQAAELLRQAKRPLIIAGHGARFSMESIISWAEEANIPVITTFKAKGLIADDHPLAGGVLGLSGTPVSAWCMGRADLLLVLGASFARHTGISKSTPAIQVDYDPMTLGKFHPVSVPVWGEIGTTVKMLKQELAGYKPEFNPRRELADQWQAWRQEKRKRAGENQGKGINSAFLFDVLSRHVSADAVIAVDVGNNTYSFGRYFECKSQSVLMSGYLGSIGYGYPAAMGAWAAAPERQIIAVTGDGGFGQYLAELTTAVKYGMPIKHILLNNMELGKISKEQLQEGKPVWSTSLHNPDFARFADNCGALGIRVDNLSDLEKGLEKILSHDGPALLEVITDPALI